MINMVGWEPFLFSFHWYVYSLPKRTLEDSIHLSILFSSILSDLLLWTLGAEKSTFHPLFIDTSPYGILYGFLPWNDFLFSFHWYLRQLHTASQRLQLALSILFSLIRPSSRLLRPPSRNPNLSILFSLIPEAGNRRKRPNTGSLLSILFSLIPSRRLVRRSCGRCLAFYSLFIDTGERPGRKHTCIQGNFHSLFIDTRGNAWGMVAWDTTPLSILFSLIWDKPIRDWGEHNHKLSILFSLILKRCGWS